MSDREWFWRCLGGVTLGLLVAVAGASGQSLAEAAKKERERRQKVGPGGPAFSDQDLKDRASGDGASAEGNAVEADKEPPPDGPGASGESYWRTRAARVRAALDAAEARVAKAEEASAQASSGLRQPLPADALKPVPPSVVPDGAKSEGELLAARRELERARKAKTDLEEEARKKGALPGWLR
jgi:hypothetical protein